MLVVGCKPPGRHTEQHDVFFGIADTWEQLQPAILAFWPQSGKMHVDAWREVTKVGDYAISVEPRTLPITATSEQLYFLNLGGYKPGEMEEFHYKILSVNPSMADAIAAAKQTAFFKHNYSTHVDDKYGVDVDDVYPVMDILSAQEKNTYQIHISPAKDIAEDELHLGYFKF